jgi:anti-sigma factor ChrR (cupin superfamily)
MKAGKEAEAATDKGARADTTASKTEDEKYLEDLVAQCEQKSNDFASRQQLRAEELEAIQKAIEIISSPDVAGNAGKHLSLAQSFALRASHKSKGRISPTVVAYLQGRADNLQSKGLKMLAMQVAETEREMADPFAKVKKMIDSMITKLLEEANEESDKKGWCDKEMAVNGQTREDKTEEVNSLTAEVDKLKADIIKLSEQVADLSVAIQEIDGAMVNATDIRLAEKEKNKNTIEDAKDAQTAVGQAIAVLKDFYAKAATATALVQQKQKQTPEEEAPETFDEPYTGMGALPAVLSGFSR